VRSPGDIFAEAEAQAREDRITGRGMPSKEPQSEVHKLFLALQISKAYADACVAEDLQEVRAASCSDMIIPCVDIAAHHTSSYPRCPGG